MQGYTKEKLMVSGGFKCKQYPTVKRMQPGKDATFELILQGETVKQHSYNKNYFPSRFARIA